MTLRCLKWWILGYGAVRTDGWTYVRTYGLTMLNDSELPVFPTTTLPDTPPPSTVNPDISVNVRAGEKFLMPKRFINRLQFIE